MLRAFGWLSFSALDELIGTLRRKKLRTLLTGLSVAWGTLMLVVLLGFGKGLAVRMFAGHRIESV
jgi:hypothetical protein